MHRRIVTFLTIVAGFLVMTAGECPSFLCEERPDLCELAESSNDAQPEFAAGDEASARHGSDLAEPRPERAES